MEVLLREVVEDGVKNQCARYAGRIGKRGFLLPPLQGLPPFSGRTNRFPMSEFRGIIGSFDVNSHEKVTIAVKNCSIDIITNEGEIQTAAAWEIGCWMKFWIKCWIVFFWKNIRNCELRMVFFHGCPWCLNLGFIWVSAGDMQVHRSKSAPCLPRQDKWGGCRDCLKCNLISMLAASFDIDVAVIVIIDSWTKMKTYPVIEAYNQFQ